MAQPAAKLLTGFFVVAALLVVAALVVTRNQLPPAGPPLPKPNGYDDLVQAARMVSDNTPDWDTMSEGDLRALELKNSEALNSGAVTASGRGLNARAARRASSLGSGLFLAIAPP